MMLTRKKMTAREVVRLAADAARREGWTLLSPVRLSHRRTWLGRLEWLVHGRGPTREHQSWVRIDDRTGEILATGWRMARA